MERYIVMRIILGLSILFVIIFIIARLAGGGDETAEPVGPDTTFVLSDENNQDSMVRLWIIGEVTAPENHRQIEFTITQDERTARVLKGYDGNVLREQSLPNTANAYGTFLAALEQEGFTEAREDPRETDRSGQCPTGRQFVYSAWKNGMIESELWSVSCSRRLGTFSGDRRTIVRLFERQFPNYDALVDDVNL